MPTFLETAAEDITAQEFVEKVMDATNPDVPPFLANLREDLQWAIDSDNPHLQQYARKAMESMKTIMEAQKMELDLGEGGFSLDSLKDILDAFKSGDWGKVFDGVKGIFNGSSGGEDLERVRQQAMQQAREAQAALQRAQADASLDQDDKDRIADMNRDDLNNGRTGGAVVDAVQRIEEAITP